MKPSQIMSDYWLKEKNSQSVYCPYDPKCGVIPGLAVKEKPKGHIVGEFVLYRDRVEVFLDKTHKMYTELVNERERQNTDDGNIENLGECH